MSRMIDQFQTIETEGAILPADILHRLSTGEQPNLTSDSYHLAPGTKLKEAITQSWTRLLRFWRDFRLARKALAPDDPGTSLTAEKWLLPLFQELGFGRLSTGKSPEIDSKVYAIQRFWNHVPIHLLGCNLDLDHRAKGVRGAATAIPHSMVQEFLNRSPDHLWAFLSNGRELRLLRDSAALSRQAYVAFDLESMMDGEVYSDFSLLWLICHVSRFEAEKPANCILETWSKQAQEQGTRILDDLRDGVTSAIESLGRGFLAHPSNSALIDHLRSGKLSRLDYYRQLLRQVYRLLFLFAAEDRGLLHPPRPEDPKAAAAYDIACQRYTSFYSTRRLRDLSEAYRGSGHCDLWHTLCLVFDHLGSDTGCPQLALPALGSFLWSTEATPDLIGPAVLIRNEDLLSAVRALAFVVREGVLRAVDYRNLGSEELGSVYESLLELQPGLDASTHAFSLKTVSGNERKTSGSYYTPDSLVQCLLDSALDPVVADAVKGKTSEQAASAILKIKVCDPACGSGHFLIAAAHRLARHLARARCNELEPTPGQYQHALRDVIGHCVYGVDINPMAVELCKVSLWMEAIEPGRPLSYLDHRIQCGNSLIGATPAIMAKGIPDEAFDPIEGDDGAVCKVLKRQNKEERKGQLELFSGPCQSTNDLAVLGASVAQLEAVADETIGGIRQKKSHYEAMLHGGTYQKNRALADAWCAAFMWRKTTEFAPAITESVFRRLASETDGIAPSVSKEIGRLAQQYQFFHWHLAFPDVFRPRSTDPHDKNDTTGWDGGFDAVLGNPPWERIQVEAIQFFAIRRPDLLEMKRSDRDKAIERLAQEDPALYASWTAQRRLDLTTTSFLKACARYALSTQKNINSYAVFLELALQTVSQAGRAGIVSQSGVATDDIMKPLFQYLMSSHRLVSLYDFENREKLFPGVDSRMKFCLITVTGPKLPVPSSTFVFYATEPGQLADPDRRFNLSEEDVASLNPNTRTCPIFRSKRSASLSAALYRRVPVLVDEGRRANHWSAAIRRMFDMAYDSHLFQTSEQIDAASIAQNSAEVSDTSGRSWLRLYEAKLMHQYDHRYATYIGEDCGEVPEPTKVAPEFSVRSRYWVSEHDFRRKMDPTAWTRDWIIASREITNTTNERTSIFGVLPRAGVGHTCYTLTFDVVSVPELTCFLANANSLCFDWTTRQKLAGTHLSVFILKQLPFLPPHSYRRSLAWAGPPSAACWIMPRVLELVYTAYDLVGFARDCGYAGPPFRWDEERRFLIRCELDAAYFHLYGISRDDSDYILETFPIVKRKDIDNYSSYRTKDTVLEMYDQMADAMAAGQAYKTWLNPPPGPPVDTQGNFIPVDQWVAANWPKHIHAARSESAQPVPEMDAAAFVALAYPADDADRAICAAALTLIRRAGTMSSIDHLDALLLVAHPAWCEAFLAPSQRQQLRNAVKNAPAGLFRDAQAGIRWKECRDYLEKLSAIHVRHADQGQPIGAEIALATVEKSLAHDASDIVGLALNALATVKDWRERIDAAPVPLRSLLEVFAEQHRVCQLVA